MQKIDFFVNKVLKPVLKKYPPVILVLLRNWENIVGDKYCKNCKPEKVVFSKFKKDSGILYIAIFNSIPILFISNEKNTIISKINTLFGYNVVGDIKIKQTPKVVV